MPIQATQLTELKSRKGQRNEFQMKPIERLLSGSGIPIRAALHGLVALPLLAFALALAVDTYLQYRSSMAAAYHTAATLREMSGKQTEEFLDQIKQSLEHLADRDMIKSLDPANCDPLLSEVRFLQPFIGNAYTINADGNIVCSALQFPGRAVHSSVAQQLIQSVDQSRDFVIGSIERGQIVDGWVLALAYMIRDNSGKYTGIVGAGVDLKNFRPLNAQNETIPGATVGIIDSSGVILASSGAPEQRIGTMISPGNAAEVLSKNQGTYIGKDYTGSGTIFSFAKIAESGWYMIVSIPETVVVAPLIRLAWYRFFIALAVMAVMISITAKVARRIAKPVEEISETISKIRSENADISVRSYGPKEIREIADELNMMLDSQKQAELSIRQSEERFRTAFQSSPDAMAITTMAQGKFLEINSGYTSVFGRDVDDVIGKTVNDISVWRYPADRQKLIQPLQEFGVCQNLEADFVTKDGRIISGLVTAHLITLDGEICVLSVIRDTTAQKVAEERIHQLSFSDALTGLPNRRLLVDRLNQAIVANNRHRRHGALLFMDIDDFKSLNDSLGHDQGDQLLVKVAERLQSIVQEDDTLARLSADEFTIILEELSTDPQDAAEQAETVYEKIFSALGQPFEIGGQSLQITCCVGITLFGKQHEEAIEPLKRAELAMYQAKSAGRNVMRFFDPQMQAIVSARTAMEQDLRKAIHDAQIQVHYQPQTTSTGEISAVEALVRWNDPRRGMISPIEFIPLAENSGLIVPLGKYVFDVVCDQLVRWSSQLCFSKLTIAVNVSARQFHEDDFVQQIQHSLKCSGADPKHIVLEITESLLVQNIDDVIAKMNALKGMGIGFSLDDFGTGYSSLSYLKQLPLDELKIDKSFIRDILIDPDDAAIAKMVVALATSMGLSVIAEGVETESQQEFLAGIDCHRYQGYLFGRPMPIHELECFLTNRPAIKKASPIGLT